MSREHVGMPGPGGSLGQCALCGKPFLLEVLTGQTVKSFNLTASHQTFYAHDKCLKDVGKTLDCTKLPAESPLRQAWERSMAGAQ